MAVTELRIEGYRSIYRMTVPMKRVNVIVGANGSGKSNLYQAVSLIRAAAEGTLGRTVVNEGGMQSVLWAGPKKEGDPILKVGVDLDDYVYDLELTLPEAVLYSGYRNRPSAFNMDPMVKRETLGLRRNGKVISLVDRTQAICGLRDREGKWHKSYFTLNPAESVLDQVADPVEYPLLDDLRRKIMKWRFFHSFRTDKDSPIRQPQPALRTRTLSHDGSDLAATLRTIYENGNDQALDAAIQDAFPGSQLNVEPIGDRLGISMSFAGIYRAFDARELSDGTLQYLCLLAALLNPSSPPLTALNEPENSLNDALLPPLGRLIATASGNSQIWLTTHAPALIETISSETGVKPIQLEKIDGQTMRAGRPRNAAYDIEWDS